MFSAFTLKVKAQQSSADWPMFRSDPSHNGVGTGNAVLTPQLLWKSTIANSSAGGYVGSSPAVVDGIVYVGSAVGAVPVGQSISPSSTTDAVYALTAKSGVELWNYSTGSLGVSSCPAVVGGVVYVGSWDGNVYALNATNGAKLWTYTTGSSVESSPTVVNGVVYVGSDNNNVYALNATNGSQIWGYNTGAAVDSSPAVVNNVVYTGTSDFGPFSFLTYDGVYALNATNGAKLWNYTASGNPVES